MKGKDTYGGRFFWLLKWVVGILFCWYLYRGLQAEGMAWPAEGLVAVFGGLHGLIALLVLVLFPVQLVLELVKWRLLLKEHVPFWWGIRSICTGMMAGLVSLNGLGDFAGRIMYLPADKRVQGTWAGIGGGLISFLAVMLVALPVFPYLLETKGVLLTGRLLLVLKVMSWILVLGLLLLYTSARHLPLVFSRARLLKAWKAHFEALSIYSKTEMLVILAISVLRFLLANLQLVLLWQVFGLNVSLLEGFFWSIGLFGLLTLVPTILITELGVRGGMALWLLSGLAPHSWQLLLPSYLLWGLNVIFPAVFGWFSMWFLKQKTAQPNGL